MYRSPLSPIGLAIVCLGTVGCNSAGTLGDPGCVTGSAIETVCSVSASASANLAPAGAPSEMKLSPSEGNCDGSCTDNFTVFLESSGNQLVCGFSADGLGNAPPLTAQTFALPSKRLSISCNTADEMFSPFEPVSGTFTINSVDVVSLHATFSMQLTRADGATFEILNGTLTIGGCHDALVCTF
jgi:hypothetical protein